MRNLSPASLAAIAQTSDLEPVIIVRVYWGGTTYTNYCDRKFEQNNLVGKLVAIGGIEDVVDINSSANSVSMTVTLDDADSSIKSIFDYNDIHKIYVQVFQWFSNLPLSDAFVIFEGEITTPLVWTEGTRTLKFDVITKLEDREVGFSVEEGKFDFIPANLVGKAWPIVFGTVAGLKPLFLNEAPTAVLSSGFGIVDRAIWNTELEDLQAAIRKAADNAIAAWNLGISNAVKASEFKGGAFFPDDPNQADQYDTAASSYYNQSSDYTQEKIRLLAELAQKSSDFIFQQSLEFRVLPITQTNIPQGVPIVVEIGNYTANAIVINNNIVLSGLTEKKDINAQIGTNGYAFDFNNKTNEYKREAKGQKFVWIDGGTQIKVFGLPRYYIASIGFITVINVWAKNKYGRAIVPANWYTVSYESFGNLHITKLIFPTPLQNLPGEWLEGDIEIDCRSIEVGTNVVDIMRWVISNFSSFGVDEASFNAVRDNPALFPANFALTQRMNVATFLKEVSFQARCAIWLNDRKFFLRFLPQELAPVETVTDADVEVNSIVITTTETERLVTKFTATWRENLNQSQPNKIIFRYNVVKYGIQEETYDFFIYNSYDYVAKAAEFWMIRKSNTWKRIQCKLMLNKIRIETFDPVQFTFNEPLISTGPVTGIIEKASFNPDDDTIAIEAWLPIRLGEMTKYSFAYPGDTANVFPALSDPNILTGNPWQDARGVLTPRISFPPHWPITFSHGNFSFTQGTGTPANDVPNPQNFITALNSNEINALRPPGINAFNNQKKYTINPIKDFVFSNLNPNIFMGFVREKKTDTLYTCDVYTSGLFKDPVKQNVLIGYIRAGSKLPDGYPIVVHRTIYIDKGIPKYEYWTQPPIWVPTVESTES